MKLLKRSNLFLYNGFCRLNYILNVSRSYGIQIFKNIGSYGFRQDRMDSFKIHFLKIVWIYRIVWITVFGSYGLLQKIVWITSQDRMDSARSYGFLLDRINQISNNVYKLYSITAIKNQTQKRRSVYLNCFYLV